MGIESISAEDLEAQSLALSDQLKRRHAEQQRELKAQHERQRLQLERQLLKQQQAHEDATVQLLQVRHSLGGGGGDFSKVVDSSRGTGSLPFSALEASTWMCPPGAPLTTLLAPSGQLQQPSKSLSPFESSKLSVSGDFGGNEDNSDDPYADFSIADSFEGSFSAKKQIARRKKPNGISSGGYGGGGRWTKEEDQRLRAAVATVGPQNWKLIAAEYLGGQRNATQCLHRWQKVLAPGLIKGPWTKEEDQGVIDCIEAGIGKWSEVADRIPGRIGKQCRERWFNHLDPSLKKGGWTEEEDAVLVESQKRWGNAWTKIAKVLDGRSENAVKNRFHSATRRKANERQRANGTADKIAREAANFVDEKLKENANTEAAIRNCGGKTDEEDTECVPRSAVALLRATRELARKEARVQASKSEAGVPPVGPVTQMLGADNPHLLPPGGEMRRQISLEGAEGLQMLNASLSSTSSSSSSSSSSRNVILNSSSSSGSLISTGLASDPINNLYALGSTIDVAADTALTERERALMHRAYLAGVAQQQTQHHVMTGINISSDSSTSALSLDHGGAESRKRAREEANEYSRTRVAL